MKTTTFIINKNTNTNPFCTNCPKSTDYSKTLDNLIAANIIKNNPYLTNYSSDDAEIDNIISASSSKFIGGCGLIDAKFKNAAKFLTEYNKNKNNIKSKFIFGKTYKLSNGMNITFYDDEIQIGDNLYSYSDFGDIIFLKKLPDNIQKTIISINIYLNK